MTVSALPGPAYPPVEVSGGRQWMHQERASCVSSDSIAIQWLCCCLFQPCSTFWWWLPSLLCVYPNPICISSCFRILTMCFSLHASQIDSFSKDLADMDALYVIVKGEMGQLCR